MKLRVDAPRALGAAFLIVIVTTLLSGLPITQTLGNGSTSDVLRHAADNEGAIRVAVLLAMLNAAGIVCLATLLYVVLGQYGRGLAIAGIGMWLGEALFYALGYIGAAALIPLGRDFVQAGAPDPSWYVSLGGFLYDGVYKGSGPMLMLFYCAGGFLFYYLFWSSRIVPRVITGFGLAVVALGAVGVVLELLGSGSMMALMAPIGLFELAVGLWLLIKGANVGASAGSVA
jgi:hypothetical protein